MHTYQHGISRKLAAKAQAGDRLRGERIAAKRGERQHRRRPSDADGELDGSHCSRRWDGREAKGGFPSALFAIAPSPTQCDPGLAAPRRERSSRARSLTRSNRDLAQLGHAAPLHTLRTRKMEDAGLRRTPRANTELQGRSLPLRIMTPGMWKPGRSGADSEPKGTRPPALASRRAEREGR